GQRAAAADHATALCVEPHRARHGEQVDTRVLRETLVLEQDQRATELWWHGLAWRKAPLTIRGNARRQQRAVARLGDIRQRRIEQRPRQQLPEPHAGREQPHTHCREYAAAGAGGDQALQRLRRPDQRDGETTSTHCPFNLACCRASYIASTLA